MRASRSHSTGMFSQRLIFAASAGFCSAMPFMRSKNSRGKMCGKMSRRCSDFVAIAVPSSEFGETSVFPHFPGDRDDAGELRFLLGLPQRISLDGAGEAALWAERQLLERRHL